MLHRLPYYDDPPAPQEPPQIHTPLSPPRSRLHFPSSSRLILQNPPTHSHPPSTSTLDSKTISRTRVSSSPRSSDNESSFQMLLSGPKADLSPPNTMPYTGPSSVSFTRRRTLSAASVSERRDSVDMDARSIISSLLDAYCQSDAIDDAWDDNTTGVFADEIASLASPSSVCNYRRRCESSSTILVSDLPTRRSKPASLLIEASPRWDSLASAPQTVPVTKNIRPLPPLPAPYTSQRANARPLPHPPFQPPPYTPSIGNYVASTSGFHPSSPRSSSASASSTSSSGSTPSSKSTSSSRSTPSSRSTSSSGSNSFTCVSSAPSSKASIDLSSSSAPLMVSRSHLLPLPLLTIPSSPSSQQPSPLPSYIPVPPSPMTARRHQATKLTRMLGEEISPEFLGPNQVSRLPSPPVVTTVQTVNQRQTSKVRNELSLPTARRIQSRAMRPNAIYVHDDNTSEESNIGDGLTEDGEKRSLFDFTNHEESSRRQSGIKIDLSVEESDDTGSSEASEILSPSDSVLEEMDDLEEARIGWALQNVITYHKAARVKRTSRMWVLENNGQRWEEQGHINVRHALRQF